MAAVGSAACGWVLPCHLPGQCEAACLPGPLTSDHLSEESQWCLKRQSIPRSNRWRQRSWASSCACFSAAACIRSRVINTGKRKHDRDVYSVQEGCIDQAGIFQANYSGLKRLSLPLEVSYLLEWLVSVHLRGCWDWFIQRFPNEKQKRKLTFCLYLCWRASYRNWMWIIAIYITAARCH